MRKKGNKGGFEKCDSRAFGFDGLSENSSGALKILSYFNGGFKLNHVPDEDRTYVENMQNNLL